MDIDRARRYRRSIDRSIESIGSIGGIVHHRSIRSIDSIRFDSIRFEAARGWMDG
tara:strand:+ start:1150 stop:1314 length:165 start_codon:yes stop_codon:yes gene_type:complete